MIRIVLADDHPIVREGLRAVLETQPDFEVIAEAASGDEALRLTLTLQPDILLLDLEMPILDGVETIRRLHQQQQTSHSPRETGLSRRSLIQPGNDATASSAPLSPAERRSLIQPGNDATASSVPLSPAERRSLIQPGNDATASSVPLSPAERRTHAGIIVFTAFDNDERIIHAVQAGANGYLLKGAPREEIFKAIRITMEGGSLLQPIVASKLLRHVGHQPAIIPQNVPAPHFLSSA